MRTLEARSLIKSSRYIFQKPEYWEEQTSNNRLGFWLTTFTLISIDFCIDGNILPQNCISIHLTYPLKFAGSSHKDLPKTLQRKAKIKVRCILNVHSERNLYKVQQTETVPPFLPRLSQKGTSSSCFQTRAAESKHAKESCFDFFCFSTSPLALQKFMSYLVCQITPTDECLNALQSKEVCLVGADPGSVQ